MSKLKIVIISLLTIAVTFILVSNLKAKNDYHMINQPATTSVKQTKKENTDIIVFDKTLSDLDDQGFELTLETNDLALYLKKDIFNIAIYDKKSTYIWYGFYPDYKDNNYTNTVNSFIESGVTIDYYDSASLNEARMSLTSKDGGGEVSYEVKDKKLYANINFTKLGISFQVIVYLDKGSLYLEIPIEKIVEVPYKTIAMKVAKEYKLQDVILFPYFGSQNYQINGYALIPDGPGALIRYTDTPYNSAYIKRIYDRDLGIQSERTTGEHLKAEKTLSTPIYGINHGYNQVAFLAEIISGYGAAELHSYPYMYNQVNLNTTFFLYKVRDNSLIKLSGGGINSIPIINKDPYPFDYQARFTFLQDDKANYTGMALTYKDHLELESKENLEFNLNLEIIGQDSKPYLFGNKVVKLTTYQDALSILKDLNNDEISINANYKSWNKEGTFGNKPYKFSLSSKLGGKRAFSKMISGIKTLNNVELSLESVPLLMNKTGIFEKTLKKTTLETFKYKLTASYIERGSMLSITGISERILSSSKRLKKYEITNLNLKDVGNFAFSYQLGKKLTYREEMINEVTNELKELSNYSIGLNNPGSYTFPFIDRYYNAPFEANQYNYITESVPFMSILLAGSVTQYSPNLNYADDLSLLTLKLIEYNLKPSFVVTKEEGHNLRYTNYEYLFSTEYDLWEKTIKETYHNMENILKEVSNQEIKSHRYILDGVSEVIYNTHIVYINYNSVEISYNGHVIPPLSAIIVEV